MRQGERKGEAGRERDKDGRDGNKEREVARKRWRDKEGGEKEGDGRERAPPTRTKYSNI